MVSKIKTNVRFVAGKTNRPFRCAGCDADFPANIHRYFDNHAGPRKPYCETCKDDRQANPLLPGVNAIQIVLPEDFWDKMTYCLLNTLQHKENQQMPTLQQIQANRVKNIVSEFARILSLPNCTLAQLTIHKSEVEAVEAEFTEFDMCIQELEDSDFVVMSIHPFKQPDLEE